jgi:hypothetical protein
MRTTFPLAVVVCLSTVLPLSGRANNSTALAADLVKMMEQRNLETVAAAHPTDPGRFVAAMHLKGVQLLVISGRYSAPALLKERLVKRDYRQVYVDLNSAADKVGRLFITDSQANGLRDKPENNAPFDISWRDMTAQVLYNNDWKSQKMNEAAYRKRFAEDEAEYVEMLQILRNSLSNASTAASP